MGEIEYKPLSYAEAVEKMKICVLANAGFHLKHISCMDCGAKPLCMKYTPDYDDTLKKFIDKINSCKCYNSSETSEICELKEEKEMKGTKVNIVKKGENEVYEFGDDNTPIPKNVILGKLFQEILEAEKECCLEIPVKEIKEDLEIVNPKHYALLVKIKALNELADYVTEYTGEDNK